MIKIRLTLSSRWLASLVGCAGLCLLYAGPLGAQSADTLYTDSGSVVRGEITSTTPAAVTVETRSGTREVSVVEIDRVRLRDEPSWLTTAKSRYRDRRFEDCYEAVSQNQLEATAPLLQQEIDYYKAMSAAHLSLGGGPITSNQAGTMLREFIDNHPDSFRQIPATEMFGDLAFTRGAFDTAVESFGKLVNSSNVQLQVRGLLKSAKAHLFAEEYSDAIAACDRIVNSGSSDRQRQLIAECIRAQAMSYQNRIEEALGALDEIIKNQSSSQEAVFARAYNAKGCCHLNRQNWKAARLAFMHTHLLFAGERDAHAEALYHLHNIARKLQDSRRAAETRQLLNNRYPNSFWTSRL